MSSTEGAVEIAPVPAPMTPLKRLRMERKLERYKVARAAAISDRTLSRWESDPAFLREAKAIADCLGVTLDELVDADPGPRNMS